MIERVPIYACPECEFYGKATNEQEKPPKCPYCETEMVR